jgi:hypothetical protein
MNIITPLMVYLPFIVIICQRYKKDSGVGTVVSLMLPITFVVAIAWMLFFAAWYLLGIPVMVVALLAFFMKEPPRGQFEKDDVLGEVFEDENPAPISMEAAFARLKKIATIRTSIAAFCALGFALFSQPGLESLYLDDTFAKQTLLQRGLILALPGIAALPVLPFIGSYFDRTYRKNPAKALALVGLLIIPSGLLLPLQFTTHSEILFVLYKAPQAVFTA